MDNHPRIIQILSLIIFLETVALAYTYFPTAQQQVSQLKTPPFTNYESSATSTESQIDESTTRFNEYINAMTPEERNIYLQ